ncbi:MAG: cyclase family protein [Deltaproteobacteria bacterium]|nr:MAG: cyclase family protein [Deltaproteobacteria bacterium]
MRRAIFLLLTLSLCGFEAFAIDERKLVDMTYPFAEDTLHWPTAMPFKLEKVNEGMTPDGYWYASYNYSGSEHVGTHLDAPFHFGQGKWTTDQVPLTKTIGPGVIIDVRRKTEADPDYRLQVADILAWEKKQGKIPRGAIALMYSGWGKFWGDRKKYFGTDQPGDTSNLHFPGFSKQAAEFLVKERKINAAGVDTPSIDHGPSRDFIAHQIFCGANTPIFENVASLDRLPAKGATLFAIPMKIKGGSGGPLRVFALLP